MFVDIYCVLACTTPTGCSAGEYAPQASTCTGAETADLSCKCMLRLIRRLAIIYLLSANFFISFFETLKMGVATNSENVSNI